MGILDRIRSNILHKSVDDEIDTLQRRERITVFVVAWVIALILWFMVNLARNFTVTLPVKVTWGDIPSDKAPTSELPQSVDISVFGEGWQIMSIYNNRPMLFVDAVEGDVSLQELVLNQMNNYAQVTATRVSPSQISINLEDRISKKIPLQHRVDVKFRDKFDFVGAPKLRPDSVTISGAKSLIERIRVWETNLLELTDIRADIKTEVSLREPEELISIDTEVIEYSATVSEYTGGEVRLLLRTRNLPPDREVSFSPAAITVKYDVPLTEYAASQEIIPFRAFVSFQEISADSSGFISPTISNVSDTLHIRLRSYYPRRVAYYYNVKE